MSEISWTGEQRSVMYHLRLTGATTAHIANTLGVPHLLVVEHLRRHGLTAQLSYLLGHATPKYHAVALVDLDTTQASPEQLVATAKTLPAGKVRKALSSYNSAVSQLRRVLAGEQTTELNRRAAAADRVAIEMKIEAHQEAIRDLQQQAAMSLGGAA